MLLVPNSEMGLSAPEQVLVASHAGSARVGLDMQDIPVVGW